jgi:hypothetical protein
MSLPSLANWGMTAHNLHKAARVLGVLRMVRLPHVPNYLEMALKIRPDGLSTDVLPGGSEVLLDFQQASLLVFAQDVQIASIPLAGQSQTSLLKALLSALKSGELADILKDVGEDALIDRFLSAASAAGHDLSSPENQISGNEPLDVDQRVAQNYGQALYRIFTGVARFRAHLNGPQTPVVVWPGHFDLSFLWFATERAEESAPHMNFGFAPYGGGIDEPYLYAYAYPLPPAQGNLTRTLPEVPAPAYWNTQGWTGVVLPYSSIAAVTDPEGYVEQMCERIFRALRPLLG